MLKTRFLTLFHKECVREVMPNGQVVDWPWFVYVRIQIPRIFRLYWFKENDMWFIYLHLGRRWWRFSPAGTVCGVANGPSYE